MKKEWVDPYRQYIGKRKVVCLPGNSSCSYDLKVALGFATSNPDMTPTLFVISVRNNVSPQGMRMNNEAYTSYPGENEILLREGCEVFVLDI